jgi:hypothetical protein
MIDVGRRGDRDPLAPAIWFLVAEAGHVGCGGWLFDRRDSTLRCVCGAALYGFHEMGRQCGHPSAAPRSGRQPPDEPD